MSSEKQTSAEIADFFSLHLQNHPGRLPAINWACSNGRRSEAWNLDVSSGQVGRGFHKQATITVMLSLEAWQSLMQKSNNADWTKALKLHQIHVHGKTTHIDEFVALFSARHESVS